MNAELKSGSSLGHYELLTRLGRGGMASVWVARERAPISGKQRLVAVKAMLPELARHSDFRAMFLEEGQIVRSIDHPHVVKVHEVSEDRGILYMAMEWVEGDSLRTLINDAKRRRAIPAEMAVKIIADTAAGLHAAHELRGWDGELRNIVHCDVSPHNILVGLDGQAKLVDFGVANATAHSAIDSEHRIKGKFGYMSPEQARAGKLDRRSDVFALGIVLFELTTGERLFRGDDAAHTLELVKNGRIPSPNEFDPTYPERLTAVVMRALARDPRERFQTASDFRDALEQYLKHERVLVSHAGVAQLVKRVLGARIEQQRQALRDALRAADGTVVTGLVPDQLAASDHSMASVTPARRGFVSEPPASASSASHSSSRTATPGPHALERVHASRSSWLPWFAALSGVAAAAGALFWVTHRPPIPLIATNLANKPRELAVSEPQRAVADPVGVNVDSLPTARTSATRLPNGTAMSDSLAGHVQRSALALHAVKVAAKEATSPVGSAALEEPKAPPEPGPAVPVTPTLAVAVAAAVPPETAPPVATPPVTLPPAEQRAPLSRGAALATLGAAAAAAAGCKRAEGPTGSGTATVTFSPDGPVKSVTVSSPFGGTPVGQCIATVFRGAHVPPFSGSPITLPKSFRIPD